MFLKLAPDTVRLRRMARAFAAGEVSEAEYREFRREIIDHFLSVAPSQNTTRRRGPDDDDEPQPAAEPVASRRWLWVVIMACLLAGAVAAWL